MKLYSMPSSGNSYKVRLLLAHLGIDYTHIGMEYETQELAHAHADGLLPLGKLPVLELEDGTQIPESNAILAFLAEGTSWLPGDPVERAHALGWMFWEQNQHEGVIAVRAALLTYESRKSLATPQRLADLLAQGKKLLGQMDTHLSDKDFFVGNGATVADLALYAYTHSAA
ncbi:MAG: glutathione S-transferase family protein, partial [Pseudomonadota bacterium]